MLNYFEDIFSISPVSDSQQKSASIRITSSASLLQGLEVFHILTSASHHLHRHAKALLPFRLHIRIYQIKCTISLTIQML
jgi:hypothetical protein